MTSIEGKFSTGVDVVCYADDTLVLARGATFQEASQLSEQGVSCIVKKLHELGLQIPPQKTEMMWFHKTQQGSELINSSIRAGEVDIPVGQQLKYLGLTLDTRWSFDEHFRLLAPRVKNITDTLHKLLPNLRGPREEVGQLYCGVVRCDGFVWSTGMVQKTIWH